MRNIFFQLNLIDIQIGFFDTFLIRILHIDTPNADYSLFEFGWFLGKFQWDFLYIYNLINWVKYVREM